MAAAVRTIVLVNVIGNHWNVIEGERICEKLGADEALGMCARLLLNTQFPPYPMDTLDEHAAKAVARAEQERKRAIQSALVRDDDGLNSAIKFYLSEWDRLYPEQATKRKRTPAAPDAGTRSSKTMAKSKDKPKRDKGRAKGGGKKAK